MKILRLLRKFQNPHSTVVSRSQYTNETKILTLSVYVCQLPRAKAFDSSEKPIKILIRSFNPERILKYNQIIQKANCIGCLVSIHSLQRKIKEQMLKYLL